jgi:ABC-type dipeptide/oligopeptide/nickel transport system permease subunit
LGTDFIGRDVLSRLLCGGTGVITAALAATAIAYAIGGFIGLLAGFVRRLDSPMMRIVDVLLSFPPVLFLLVVAAGAGRGLVVLSLAIAVTNMPAIARIIRSAVVEHRQRAYVEAAILRGETTSFILVRELLPNIIRILLADLGLRFTWSMLLVASVSFLGLGSQPPAPNWALMISENRPGMELQPWAVAAPAILIALLTVSVNVVADAFASRLGSSVTDVVR